jgi:hypothetical protein
MVKSLTGVVNPIGFDDKKSYGDYLADKYK